jgi:predicted secreted protein with PEFG-CTERM motif
MRFAFFILPLFVVIILGSTTLAFAETYEIKIPQGASNSGAFFFWSEKSTGVTTGVITVYPGDSVIWHNADTAFHTITSGIPPITVEGTFEEDGVFDSGMFTVGKSYARQFDDLGDFHYYCSLHPWMDGVVHVVTDPGSVQSISRIASGYSDDGLGFEVKYILDTNLQNAVHVNSDERTLTFTISGNSKNEQITFVLPDKLIENPNAVWVDGDMVDFEIEETSTGTKLTIPIDPSSKEIKIMGAYVIPEFGFLVMVVLSVGLFSTLFLSRSKLSII